MRWIASLGIAVCVVGLGMDRVAADQGKDRALVIVNRAIDAQGGADRLAKLHVYERVARGKEFASSTEVIFTTTLVVALPDRLHDAIEVQAMGGKVSVIQIVNAGKGWRSTDGKVEALSKEELKELATELYVRSLGTLVSLKEDAFQLTVLPDAKVDGRVAHVVQVETKDRPAVKLYFDGGNGLLVKTEFRVRQASLSFLKEYRLSQYKRFDGLKLPTVQTGYLNGTKAEELTITAYHFMDEADSSLFEQPKAK